MNKSNKNSGFKTPESYFENFTDKLMDKLSEEDPVLPKEEGFVAPEGYFDSLHKNIKQKLDGEETKVVQLHRYRKYYFAAASVAAVALVVFGLNRNAAVNPTFENLASSDIENYFESNDLGLSTYEIAEVIPVDELEITDILKNQLNEDNVIEYLNDNIDDFDELNLDSDE